VFNPESGAGVDTLTTNPNTSAIEEFLTRTRQNLYEFGRGIDTQNEDLGNASGQAIKFRYGDLDMDCNIIESEFQSSFEQVEWYIKQYLKFTNKGDFMGEDAQITFHRDVIVNEQEIVNILVSSKGAGILSDQTIIERHPYAAEDEVERIEAEREKKLQEMAEYQDAFAAAGGGQEGGSSDDASEGKQKPPAGDK
jgi:SPP1 family phage portal protein